MATLKICAVKTIWITGIKRIIEVSQFEIDKDEKDIMISIKKAGVKIGSDTIHLMEFKESTKWGVVLFVQREDCYNEDSQTYIFPYRSAFLMSESGATIDRI